MHIPRLLISALRGGAGKTLLSLGLARAFVMSGRAATPYKKGPDYIDAAWLARAAGVPCTNLDPYFLDADRLRALFAESFARASAAITTPAASPLSPLALIEGNRGLFDGRDVSGSCSSAHLARVLGAPVLLALDITKMTRTAAAIVAGLTHFEEGVRIGGVVLNQAASARHESIVRQSIEAHTGVPVLGVLPRMRHNPLPERHMGLVGDGSGAEEVLDDLGALVADHVDLTRVWALAESAQPLPATAPFWPTSDVADAPRVRIGYVKDAALWFYYAENLEALERAGATLVPLSVLDASPWPQLDGLYLGGGFPEEYGQALAASGQLAHIRALSEAGLPIYAECGGLMLLAGGIAQGDERLPMAGVFPLWVQRHARPQGLGYVEAHVVGANPFHPQGAVFRGHEFHYSRCVDAPTDTACLRLTPGTGMGKGMDGLCVRNTFAAYTHVYAPATPHWAQNFVALCREGGKR